MAEELSKDEQELLAKHRAEKAKRSRKVTVKGKHEDSGAEYSFELDGDEAERVIARHKSLFEEQSEDDKSGKDTKGSSSRSGPYFKGNKTAE